jgi:hypothetical protein
MRATDLLTTLAQALRSAGRPELAEQAAAGALARSEASLLSYEFCRVGEGRLATLLATYAHPSPC